MKEDPEKTTRKKPTMKNQIKVNMTMANRDKAGERKV